MSSASDTISYNVILELLSPDWFELLDAARSQYFTYEGRRYPLEKISSMGNAFTFELESLIFLALARATCEVLRIRADKVNVYGDDVIIPVAAYDLFSEILNCLGFEVNQAKSFKQGPFRESCGKDWFLGSEVRPLFLKSSPTPATVMYWCNHIRRCAGPFVGDPTYFRWWSSLKRLVPKAFHKLEGPDGQGDGHFIIPKHEYTGNRYHDKKDKGWEGWGFYTIESRPILFRAKGDASYALAMYNAEHPPEKQTEIPNKWDLATTRRRRTRSVLTKSFARWADVCTWEC
jgi:hypothetical protein